MRQALTIAFALLCLANTALGKEAAPGQGCSHGSPPRVIGKPVTTTTIKRCPEGYELVTRANGQPGCAKDIVPAN
jgi:hypothetical protein